MSGELNLTPAAVGGFGFGSNLVCLAGLDAMAGKNYVDNLVRL